MGIINLSDKQQRRAEILTRLREGQLSVQQASVLLGVSERQVRRQRSRYRALGLASLVHANTGRTPAAQWLGGSPPAPRG